MPRTNHRVLAATLAVTLALPLAALAQDPSPPPPPAVEEETAASSSPRVMDEGRINSASATEVAVRTITLRDGQTLRGKVVSENEEGVVLELTSGGRMDLARSSIRSISEEQKVQVSASGEVWFRDPNRTRYFYAPSAMLLRKGEGYFSQKELLFSAVAYGVTDNVTVLVGSVMPFWFMPNGSGVNLIGAVKVGFSPTEKLHLAAGAETLYAPFFFNTFSNSGGGAGAGFVFGSLTYGDSNGHITISGGRPFAFTTGSGSSPGLGDALFVVGTDWRLTQNLAFVTENWFMPYLLSPTPDLFSFHAVGGRIFGERWAVDLAMIFVPRASGGIPIPWVDFTYNFGG